jgi:hypothetical protein
MQESDSKRGIDEEIVLPEETMPSLDQMMQMQGADQIKTNQRGPKKQKVWGPIQPVRLSSRIDRSKHIMDKAMELKEKKNSMLPTKMSGIMNSNPFHVLQNSEFVDMSSKLGVVINEDDEDILTAIDTSHSVDPHVSKADRDSFFLTTKDCEAKRPHNKFISK